jgi:UDP-N-acetylglucosamine--N-acetylmuramyl-(pentapeptide) pyrophosphoryl-undecaprenol N-acetylglucosamine transferase
VSLRFVFTGGGTGGHVFPALAVARVLRGRGHEILFIGTREGIEARLAQSAQFPMEFVRSSGLNRVGWQQQLRTVAQLPGGIAGAIGILRRFRPAAVFSTGGYVAGPVMLAALLARIPLVVMEANMVPGFANRQVASRVARALLAFPQAAGWFPADRSEITGLPVRPEFFSVPPKTEGAFTVLITGGSRGARTLNRASRESWPLFRALPEPPRIVHQSGTADHAELEREFASTGLAGVVAPFFSDMADQFAEADVVVARAGAGSVNEIAAAGMASVLVPLPFAADDHQRRNAEALVTAGAARMVLDRDMTGRRLFEEVEALRSAPGLLAQMRERVRQFAHRDAAERAAEVMEDVAKARKVPEPR